MSYMGRQLLGDHNERGLAAHEATCQRNKLLEADEGRDGCCQGSGCPGGVMLRAAVVSASGRLDCRLARSSHAFKSI